MSRAKEIFLAAIELPAAQQLEFARRACGDDHSLHSQVQDLLRLHRDSAYRLDEAVERIDQSRLIDASARRGAHVGQRIGRYRLIELLGEGGFGSVYLAEQTEPVVRHVALKLIKRGMDTDQVIARFALERQALAMMDHPGIARVFDAGATETGQPYFVMEYVSGLPVTQFCSDERLSVEARLELIEQVCLAVQHAHQKGIIHRDLKPANILVTRVDQRIVPKVIDFGVAKATDPTLPNSSAMTLEVQIVGTPQYMAPEQAQTGATQIDTRTDVYSIGAVLYELVAGTPPFDPTELRSAGIEEMCRIIRQRTPVRPSARASDGNVSSEIDWIVMKAIEKEPARRYQSPAELAADIRRHLSHEAVLAGPPSTLYQFRKFARRNRKPLVFAATIALLLVCTAVISVVLAQRARRAQARAVDELARANTIVDFTNDLLGGIAPSVARGRDTALLRDLLDRSILKADQRLLAQPELDLSVRNIIGDALSQLGDEEAAVAQLRRIFDATANTSVRDHPQRIRAGVTIANILAGRSDTDAAQRVVTECDESLRRARLEDSDTAIEVALSQAAVHLHSRRPAEAEALYRTTLARLRQRGKGESEAALRGWNNLALSIGWQGRWDEAADEWRRLNAVDRRVYGEDHPYTLMTLMDIGTALNHQQKLEEAEAPMRDALAVARRIYDAGHPTLLVCMNNLGSLLLDRNDVAGAETILLEAYETGKQKLRRTDMPMDTLMLALSKVRNRQGRYDDAATFALELHATAAEKFGAKDGRTYSALVPVYQNLLLAGRIAEGVSLVEQHDDPPAYLGGDIIQLLHGWGGQLYLAKGNRAGAQRELQRGLAAARNDETGNPRLLRPLRELEQKLATGVAPTTKAS